MAIGIISLVNSRMKDIRWLSVYLICLPLLLLCCVILFTVCDMTAVSPYGMQQIKLVMAGGIFVLVVFAFAIKMEMKK